MISSFSKGSGTGDRRNLSLSREESVISREHSRQVDSRPEEQENPTSGLKKAQALKDDEKKISGGEER